MKKIVTSLVAVLSLAVLFTACCESNKKNESTMSTQTLKIAITAHISIKPEKVADFIEGTKNLIDGSRSEAGNISYTLYQEPTDSTKFMFFEEWKDQAAIDFHFNTEHYKNFGALANECAASAPQIKIMNVSSEK